MKTRSLEAIFAAMLGACLFACDSNQSTATGATGPNPEGKDAGNDFDRSVLTIKAMNATQQEKISAIDALVSRYGHIVVAPQPADPATPDEGTILAGPLQKAASVTRYYATKGHNLVNQPVLHLKFAVTYGQTFTAWTTRPAGSLVDPFIVAYYQPGTACPQLVNCQPGLSGDNGAFAMKVAGLDDDGGGGLDSRVTWTNRTGATQWIHCYAFSYSSSTGGVATLVSQVNGFTPEIMTGEMHGLVEYDNNMTSTPADGCTGPNYDRLTLRKVASGGDSYAIMLVNSGSKQGGVIYSQSGLISQAINLPGPATPSGYPNFMLWFNPPVSNPSGTTGNYAGFQNQAYSCPG